MSQSLPESFSNLSILEENKNLQEIISTKPIEEDELVLFPLPEEEKRICFFKKERVLTQLSFESSQGTKPEEAKVSSVDSEIVDNIKRKRNGENLLLDERLKKMKQTIEEQKLPEQPILVRLRPQKKYSERLKNEAVEVSKQVGFQE